MSLFNCSCNCNCRCNCTVAAIIISAIIGVVATILQITAAITLAPIFLWIAFGIAVLYLGVVTVAAALAGRTEGRGCVCNALNTLLVGILGTIALAAVLAVVGITATSILSAVLVGVLLAFLALTFLETVCLIRYLADCRD